MNFAAIMDFIIAALMGKIQGGSWSFWNSHIKIALYTNFHASFINLNNYALFRPLTSGLYITNKPN